MEDRKLCGYVCVVLSVKENPHTAPGALVPGTPCSLFAKGSSFGFRSETGIKLLPLGECNAPDEVGGSPASLSTPFSRKKGRRGLVNGNTNVVHQLHVLTAHKYLRIHARVVRVSTKGAGTEEGTRVVVLVDLYLPIEVWSGWQFPRSRALASSLFMHVSCNWEERASLLNFGAYSSAVNDCFWCLSTCHVLGCKMHQNSSASLDKRLFDLHEIFKSLPSVGKGEKVHITRIKPEDGHLCHGMWNISDDVLTNVLKALDPKDLVRIAATCRHLRSLASLVMPCLKLKLFPHQEAAVEWMLQRERNPEVLLHPLYMHFSTEDGFPFHINVASAQISTAAAPTMSDFRGGMFCDEPGLGKTVTALSLILKTHGALAEPPHGIDVIWCKHNSDRRCGYYELNADDLASGSFMPAWKRFVQNSRREKVHGSELSAGISSVRNSKSSSLKDERLRVPEPSLEGTAASFATAGISSAAGASSGPVTPVLRCTRNYGRIKRNLFYAYEEAEHVNEEIAAEDSSGTPNDLIVLKRKAILMKDSVSPRARRSCKKTRRDNAGCSDSSETWVQCDACRKWRKLSESKLDATTAWFCSMNKNPLHQSCATPEESWDHKTKITSLPGFYSKGALKGIEQNASFFTSILKEHFTLFNSETKKALTWLANLSQKKLSEMETVGVARPILGVPTVSDSGIHGYAKIFQAFGLVRKVERGTSRWYYPCNLDNLEFDVTALKIALTRPLDSLRLYLSRATLIVVPTNLVDHWKSQIQKHVTPGQLCVYVWTDHRKPSAHNLAWDYDIVITTFSRLSAEWSPRKRSILMQIHWLRVVLDEGHTLGSSLSLTNKLQMAISLAATNRWILTGTPTPNTPNSQVAHLHPMLKFLHEQAYGESQDSWEAGILRPFEAMMEEGRVRLLQLLLRTMISARKTDLKSIPPCIKKVIFLQFTEEHARSYNELVVTVRRNILMADWNDPSHIESLLNPKQWKFRSNTIRNVRLSCCVAGHIKVTDAGQDIQDTMDILVQQGLNPLTEEYLFIKDSLINGCFCFRCKNWCRLPVITPCRHLLCLECVALDSERCTFPGCSNHYEMQSPEILARPENTNPKWPVPKDLIELQPSYKQDDWDPDWHATSSSKVAYLVKRMKELQESNRKRGYLVEGVGDRQAFCSSQKSHSSESSLWVNPTLGQNSPCNALPEKVIIFSQFLEHIHVIEQQLTIAGINFAGMYSPMHSSNKMKALMLFQHDASCMALVMDGTAALGLDLSFVTHVFLMEPIWDRSMEEQVISRAHRMGATRPIFVETLAMYGTIEEQMLEFLQETNGYRRVLKRDSCKFDQEGTRDHRTLHDFAESNYLAQLSFVRTNNVMKEEQC